MKISDFLIKEPFLFDDINANDYLETQTKVELFIKKIENVDNGTIGLVSQAGSGKSFFLKILYDKLKSDKNIKKDIIYLDISNYQEISDIFVLLMSIILSEIDKNKGINDFLYFTKNYFGGIINALDDSSKIKQSYKILKALLNVGNDTANIYKNSQKDKIDEFLRIYKKSLKEKKYILIVDNLEKCSPEYVVNFFLFTRKIIDNNILIILSYDKSEMVNSLKNFYGNDFNTQNFFRKFILLEFYIEKYYDKIENLIDNLLPENILNLDIYKEDYKKILGKIYKNFNLTLRLLIMLIYKLGCFLDFLDEGKDVKYLFLLIIYKFICEDGYEKIYYECQRRNNISEDLSCLNENEKTNFEKLKNYLWERIQVGNKEFDYNQLKDYFKIIEV